MRKMSVMMHANKLLLLPILILDQYQYLGSCPPTPPLTQQQSIDQKFSFMLG